MTPKQKKLHIESIINIIEEIGFTEDRYGNYKKICKFEEGEREYRIKIMKNNLRREVKSNKMWLMLQSVPLVRIDLEKFRSFMNIYK